MASEPTSEAVKFQNFLGTCPQNTLDISTLWAETLVYLTVPVHVLYPGYATSLKDTLAVACLHTHCYFITTSKMAPTMDQ